MSRQIIGSRFDSSVWQKEAFKVTPRLFRLLVLMSTFSFIAVYTTGYLRGLTSFLSVPLLLMLFLGRGLLRRPAFVQMLSMAVMFYSLYSYNNQITGVVALVEFTCLILFLQLQVADKARTVAGAIVLSLMLVLVVAAMNVNFLFPLSLFPYLIITSLTLGEISFLWHQSLAGDDGSKNFLKTGFVAKPWKYLVIMIAYLVVWISLFYLVPRSDAYGLASETSKRRLTGFDDSLRLGEGGLLEDNPTVVMRIRPAEGNMVSSSVFRRMRSKLLRGTTFPNYAAGRWYRAQSRRYFVDLRKTHGQFVLIEKLPAKKKLHQIEVILENTDPPVIFVPDQTAIVELDSPFIAVENDYSMYFLGKTSGRRIYLCRLLIDPIEVLDSSVEELDLQGHMRMYLSKIGIDARIQDLADKIASGSNTINQRITATISYLQKNCTYSLYEDKPVSGDPTAHFLFNSKAGSCEHFASAMTLLLRAMRIPARPVNGYSMGEWNDMGGFFTIRQRHAHTWVEVFFPKSGWVPFDPSPPGEIDEPDTELEILFVYLWEIYEGHWFNYVYNFDQNTQMIGFKKISRAVEENLSALIRNFKNHLIAVFLLLIFAFFSYKRFQRRLRAASWMPDWYQDWTETLEVRRNGWETPTEFHNRLLKLGVFASDKENLLKELANLVDLSSLGSQSPLQVKEKAMEIFEKFKNR
jgi:transglutaminase-like putative cysteine protease